MTARDQLSSELKGRGDAVEKLQTELAGAKSQLECLNLIKSELELKNAEKVELSETVAKLKVCRLYYKARHLSHRLSYFSTVSALGFVPQNPCSLCEYLLLFPG